jgi:glucokinase
MDETAIGVDIGATKIASARVTREGKILARRETQTRVERGADAVIHDLANEITALAEDDAGEIRGAGIGVPGLVNPDFGVVIRAVNMRWQNIPLAERLRAALGRAMPVWVDNDVRAALRGEALFGAGRECADFVLLTIGSGLGSAAMVNGQVVRGARHFASEAGHFVIDPQGRACSCGLRGCAETVLSGDGLVETTREFLAKQYPSALEPTALTTRAILEAARASDPAALAAVERMGEWLGIVMASATAWLNPARIIIGGGLGNAAFDLLYAPAVESYAGHVLGASREGVEITRSQVQSSALGGAALAFQPP